MKTTKPSAVTVRKRLSVRIPVGRDVRIAPRRVEDNSPYRDRLLALSASVVLLLGTGLTATLLLHAKRKETSPPPVAARAAAEAETIGEQEPVAASRPVAMPSAVEARAPSSVDVGAPGAIESSLGEQPSAQKPARLPGEPPGGLNRSEWSSIRAAHQHWLHSFVKVDGGYRARNKGNHFVAAFDERGFTILPDGGGWAWGLELVSYGFAGQEQMVPPSRSAQAEGQRLVNQRDPNLQEWFLNDSCGLEQGWILRNRPGTPAFPGEPLRLRLAQRGEELVPTISADAQEVSFGDDSRGSMVGYGELKALDAQGKLLAASFELAEGGLVVAIQDAEATYPLIIDPIVQSRIAQPQVGLDPDNFGSPVAVSGDTVVVGAVREDSRATGVNGNQADNSTVDSGAAYVFVRGGTNWTQQAYLKASNTGANDMFGVSVAVSGDTVVVGVAFEDSAAIGVNGNQADNSAADSGAVYVFVRSGTTWAQQAYLKASNTGAGDQFGVSVALSENTVVVGANAEDSAATGVNGSQISNSSSMSGAAYVFVRGGSTWTQQAYLKASNTGVEDQFGTSVALSGDTVAIGAATEDSKATGVNGSQGDNSASSAGAVYLFVRSGTTWTQEAYLKASNTGANDLFGYSVAMSGATLVVGAFGESSSSTGVNGNQTDNSAGWSGAAYVFVRNGTTWNQQAYLKASNTGAYDWFGYSAAVSSDTVVIGAHSEDSSATGVNGIQADNSADASGAAYVFVRSGTTWTQQAYLKASSTDAGDFLGNSVGVSGDTVVVGSPYEDRSATGVNGNQADNSSVDSGAACVFVRNGTTWTQQAFFKASNTGADDHFGDSVAVSGDTVVVGAPHEDSSATGVNGNQADNSAVDSGAAYVFVRTGNGWTQQAYLKASNSGAGDIFGSSVAASGDTVLVGAVREDSSANVVNGNQGDNNAADSGAAYVFVRSGSAWTQQAYLKASNTGASDFFGASVALSGDKLVVGAHFEASSATGVNGNQANNSLMNAGAAYVFVRSGTNWSQQAYLKASNTGYWDSFGGSVAVSGDTVVVGAAGEESNATGVNGNQANNSFLSAGAAYVFVATGTNWSQQAYLKASNTGADDQFGVSVAVSGDTVVVGAAGEDSSANVVNGNQSDNSASYAGAAYVFVRSGSAWTQQAYLKASNTGADDQFGVSVAVSGDTVVVGAFGEGSSATGVNGNQVDNSLSMAGAAYVFVRSGTDWTQQAYLKASDTGTADWFGDEVAVSGDTVVTGSSTERVEAFTGAGAPALSLVSIFYTHSSVSGLNGPAITGTPEVRLPQDTRIDFGPALRDFVTNGVNTLGGYGYIACKQVAGRPETRFAGTLYADNNGNYVKDPGEPVLRADFVVSFASFEPVWATDTVPMKQPIQPPSLAPGFTNIVYAREVLQTNSSTGGYTSLIGPDSPLSVTTNTDGSLMIVPDYPAAGIRVPWRSKDSFGIEWFVDNRAYQVQFDPGTSPIRMARDPAATGGGAGMALPSSGLTVTVVFASDLSTSNALTQPTHYEVVNNQFLAKTNGLFVLKFDPTPAQPRNGDETYQAVLALDHESSYFGDYKVVDVPIGTEVPGPVGAVYGIVQSGSCYAATLPDGNPVYGPARNAWRQSQIVPVNTDAFEVWWHSEWTIPNTAGLKVEFPALVRRYRSLWPDIPASGPLPAEADTNQLGKIVIASEQGSGPISTNAFKAWGIYYQNTNTLPGFNPNDEHALIAETPGTNSGLGIFALRDDFGRTNTSEPYVLMHYRDANDTDSNPRYRMKVFRVVAEDATQGFTLSCTGKAGDRLEGPYPLELLAAFTNGVRKVDPVSDPDHWFKSRRNGEVWAKSAGNDGTNTATVELDWYYEAQPSFYWPANAIYHPGQPVPFLDANTGNPRNVSYIISWREVSGFIRMGETLVTSKNSVSGMMLYDKGTFYLSRASAEIAYDQVHARNPAQRSVRLIDYAKTISVPLTNVPQDVRTEATGDTVSFAGLPPLLSRRLSLDARNNLLRLGGYAVQEANGDPYLLLNVISPSERNLLLGQAFCGKDPLFKRALSNLCYQASAVQEIAPTNNDFESMALTAGYADGPGYVTLAFNDNPDVTTSSDEVGLEIIKVKDELYRGTIRVVQPEAVFDDQVSVFVDADLAGMQDNYQFEWKAIGQTELDDQYLPAPTGTTPALWEAYATQPSEGTGARCIVSVGSGSIADRIYTCRYTPSDSSHPLYGQWSVWSRAYSVNGWIKRVMTELNALNQRTKDLTNSTVDTTVSMISQAGKRWEGDIPFTRAGAEKAGLIEAYQSILNRAFSLTLDMGTELPDEDNALILAVGKLSDLYMLLGNEAYADACDPTLSVGAVSGSAVGSLHCFMNMAGGASLLEEELSLLRGRDDLLDFTDVNPVYNRLPWNFLGGVGQTAYVNNYGIREYHFPAPADPVNIDMTDAAEDYPQGHGDAWGHYLSALKYYYRLLRDPHFTWQRRSELISVGGQTYNVDYQDEQKFAKAAAARAQAGSEILSLTYRDRYKEDPRRQWTGYKDTVYTNAPNRAWGVDEWGVRAGQGTYLDWVMGNALLPANDTNHTSIDKVDRTTVTELRDLAASLAKIQTEVDKADTGLNPVGLIKGVLPMYELTPADVENGRTLFEKAYEKSVTVLNNALAVFQRADGASQKLREQSDKLQDFQATVNEREMDFRNRLIETYGYPYPDDIGTGKTYPPGYDGPDIHHYYYVDPSELTGVDERNLTTQTVTVRLMDQGLEYDRGTAGAARVDTNGVLMPVEKEVSLNLSTSGYGTIKPVAWKEGRKAHGQLQVAHSELLQARGRLDRAVSDYDAHLKEIEGQVESLETRKGIQAEEIWVQNAALNTQVKLNQAIKANRQREVAFRSIGRIASLMSSAVAESIPTSVIGGLAFGGDFGSAGRAAIRILGTLTDQAMSVAADAEGINELGHQQAKEIVQAQSSITLATLNNEDVVVTAVKQIESLIRQEASLRLEIYTSKEALVQSAERYRSLLAQGERVLEERLVFRQKTAANVQQMRYKDMAFRIFRNDALEKYRAQFDVAAAWVYMAARAYDYETCGTGGGAAGTPAQGFLESIVKTRAIGEISSGQPITSQSSGDGGLADPMARMKQNWDTLKGQLGYNQPQHETTRFSLRKEFFRIPDGPDFDKYWRETLQRLVIPDARLLPEFVRYCKLTSSVEEPAIVIPFPTLIQDGFNFFGWPLAGGDNSYSTTVAATKIHKTGVWLDNYNNTALGLANTPRVYLVPVGADIMRSPQGNATREWRVAEQVIPTPFALTTEIVNSLPAPWVPAMDSFDGSEAEIRRFAEFRAYHDSGSFNPAELTTDTRLIGRSVWNTRWLLVIRGRSLLSDPNEGIQRFINGAVQNGRRTGQGISDIKLTFQTYAIPGN